MRISIQNDSFSALTKKYILLPNRNQHVDLYPSININISARIWQTFINKSEIFGRKFKFEKYDNLINI